MTYVGSTGAKWLDVATIGAAFFAIALIFGLELWTRPGQSIDPAFSAFLLGFILLGIGLIALGIWLGRRTGWKVPDPSVHRQQTERMNKLLGQRVEVGLAGVESSEARWRCSGTIRRVLYQGGSAIRLKSDFYYLLVQLDQPLPHGAPQAENVLIAARPRYVGMDILLQRRHIPSDIFPAPAWMATCDDDDPRLGSAFQSPLGSGEARLV